MKSFNRLTKQEKIEYLAMLLLLPFAYIWHLFRKANFRTLPKRAVAVCLAVVMIAVMIPIMSIPASATEYSGGSKVSVKALKSGDTIRKGSVIINGSDVTNVCRTFSPTDTSGYANMGSWWNEGSEWSADDNYYVVDVEQQSPIDPVYLYIYRIVETSAVTFYPAGGTIQGGTAAKTFTATKYLSDYCDVSWLTPSRPGCTFLGWYTSDGKEQVYNANGKAVNGTYWKNNLWQGQGAKSFIAKWKANTSVTFRYFPNGGTGQPDNFVQWTANATYFDTYPSDSHWNYTTGTYKLTRVGYTATGNYAKKDGSCVVHEDDNFTSYPQLCNAYGLNPDTCGNATIDIYAQWAPLDYQVSFNGNGATGGSMANQAFTYDTPQALTPNAFERVYMVTYNENGGAELPDGKAVATFNGWQDRGSIVYKDGITYTFADFDGAGYGLRNSDVFVSSGFGNGIFNKYGLLDHYVIHGKGEYANGSTSRAPTTDEPYGYPNGATVSNLSTTNGATVPLYALWTPGSVTLPTPTKAGHTFNGWYTEATGGTKVGVAGASYTPVANTTLYAQWTANSYTVNVSATPTEGGTVSGGGSYDYGASATVTATANNGYRFVNWTENGTSVSTDASYTFTATGARNLVANFELITYTVTWKNYDGTVLETDTGVTYGTAPAYNGATPQKAEDENFTYTFDGWSPTVSAVTGDTEYTAQFTAISKRVEPTYTVTIPATVNEGESFKVSATGVVLNTDQTLTVTLQSDFTFRNEQGAELPFVINNGNIGNNAVVLSITGNGDKNNPLAKDSDPLVVKASEEATYAGTYTGTITFVVAVNPAENN